ncbi:uncharacterized protein LOC135477596 [Liolophura sinensis]|uniref:uncharacterized protein LOC135477596 n=1 Tax=Liolophura sinensis TaxID=3198878 RepID=UPI003158A7CE
MILGAGCSLVSQSTSQASHLWNQVQISYISTSPALSDKSRFPRFFRLNAPDTKVNPARVEIIKQFGWKRVATIHQSLELFSTILDGLLDELALNNVTVITSEIFRDDPKTQIENLKKHDARIIIGDFYQDMSYKVFCEAYKQKLYGSKIVWLITGWLEEDWWVHIDNTTGIDCTVSQLKEAIEGHFAIRTIYLNPKEEAGVAGLTASEFQRAYYNKTNHQVFFGDIKASLSYDCTWAIALALNDTLTNLTNGTGRPPRDSVEVIVKVQLVSPVLFAVFCLLAAIGIILGMSFLAFNQYFKDQRIIKMSSPRLNNVILIGCTVIYATVFFEDINGQVAQMCWIKTLFLLTGFSLTFGGLFSKTWRVYVIFTNPKLERKVVTDRKLFGMVAALLAVNMSVFVAWECVDPQQKRGYNNTPENVVNLAEARGNGRWGGVFVWKNVVNLAEPGGNGSGGGVFVRKNVVNLAEPGGNGRWGGVFVRKNVVNLAEPGGNGRWGGVFVRKNVIADNGDTVYQPQINRCESQYQLYFLGVLYAIQGILLLFGSFLAWETRKVKLQALNDSHYIGMSIYNVVVLSLLAVLVSVFVDENVNLLFGLLSGITVFGTTATQCLVFVPKIMYFKESRTGPMDDHVSKVSTLPTTTSLDQRLNDLQKQNREKLVLIEQLRRQLKMAQERIVNVSPLVKIRVEGKFP